MQSALNLLKEIQLLLNKLEEYQAKEKQHEHLSKALIKSNATVIIEYRNKFNAPLPQELQDQYYPTIIFNSNENGQKLKQMLSSIRDDEVNRLKNIIKRQQTIINKINDDLTNCIKSKEALIHHNQPKRFLWFFTR